MNDKIQKLVSQIEALKAELQAALNEQEIRYRAESSRLEEKFRQTQDEFKEGLYQWLRSSQPRNVLSAPFIYGMIVPMVFFDLCLTVYQLICFRLYRMPRVRRRDYLVFDRHRLAYLNAFQKINCTYCAYGNGLIAYAREISARTEQYWCPIKHAQKVADPHGHYHNFVRFGDAEAYHARQGKLRNEMRQAPVGLASGDPSPPKPEVGSES
ncbi:MAG: hypothetical protein ACPGF7_06195 [Pontibacterium sp.]